MGSGGGVEAGVTVSERRVENQFAIFPAPEALPGGGVTPVSMKSCLVSAILFLKVVTGGRGGEGRFIFFRAQRGPLTSPI